MGFSRILGKTMFEPTVPSAPRIPTQRAQTLIFDWNGVAKSQRNVLIAALVLTAFCAMLFSIDLPLDWFISANPKEVVGRVIGQKVDKGVKVLGQRPTRIHFTYVVGGETHEGSVSTLEETVIRQAQPGAAVTVEYDAEDPGLARIKGTSYATFGWVGAAAWLPFCGGVLALVQLLRKHRLNKRAYLTGAATPGRITFAGPDPRYANVKNAKFHKITWEYQVAGRPYKGEIMTTKPDDWADVSRAENWPIVYDPAKPGHGVLYF